MYVQHLRNPSFSLPGDRGKPYRTKLSSPSLFLGQQRTKNEQLAESLGLPRHVSDAVAVDDLNAFTPHRMRVKYLQIVWGGGRV